MRILWTWEKLRLLQRPESTHNLELKQAILQNEDNVTVPTPQEPAGLQTWKWAKEMFIGEKRGGERRRGEKEEKFPTQAIPIAHGFNFCSFNVLGLPESKKIIWKIPRTICKFLNDFYYILSLKFLDIIGYYILSVSNFKIKLHCRDAYRRKLTVYKVRYYLWLQAFISWNSTPNS